MSNDVPSNQREPKKDILIQKFEDHLHRLKQNHKLNLREQYEQFEVLESKPLHVAVPTGDRCNLSCTFCTDRTPPVKYLYTDLTYNQFLNFTEPLEMASLVQLYGWGEPFFNPEYERMFDHIAEHYAGTRIYISTNGVLLTEKWIDKLLTYRKCLINVSVNASSPETYAQIMGADQFQRVIDNIDKMMKMREARGITDMVVTLSFVAIRQNIQELPSFLELSAELGINFVILQDLRFLEGHHEEELFLGKDETEARHYFLEALDLANSRGIYLDSFTHYPVPYFSQKRDKHIGISLPRDCLSVWEQVEDTPFYPQPGECYEPYTTFLVSQDGSVTTCCRSKEVMGNLCEQSFDEIWNGKKYREYRRTINTFRPPEACSSCPVKMGSDTR